jgi:hypothetical protein
LYDLRGIQSNFIDALPFAEEAYDIVAIAYNPVHPKVQKAAGVLIQCLICKGDLYNGERFAENNLGQPQGPSERVRSIE